MIELEKLDRRRTLVGIGDDSGTTEMKMVGPLILTRVKEPDETRRAADVSARVGAFGNVAAQAGKSEIRGRCSASLFSAYDVIHLKGESSVKLMNKAILADTIGSIEDETPKSR
jgi:hypothetical protein